MASEFPISISVIVPTFNRRDMLSDCLNSLLAENHPSLEILVVDDGSSDGTEELLKSFPVQSICLDKNRGPGAARNEGLRRARGKYICFLDSDDVLVPGGLRWREEWLDAHPNESAILGSMESLLAEKGDPLNALSYIVQKYKTFAFSYKWKDVLAQGLELTSPLSGSMIRTEMVKRLGFFDEIVRGPEDVDFFYRLLKATDVCYLPKPVFRYRIHSTNLSISYRNGHAVSPLRIEIERRLIELSHGMPGEWPDPVRWRLPDIVIPVFNRYDEVRACLDSVMKHTPEFNHLFLVDDCSTDSRIAALGESLSEKDTRIQYIRTDVPRGFVETVNYGLGFSTADVVLLNSRTLVARGWLDRLCACFYSKKTIGLVSPTSNGGGILSLPFPDGWTFEDYAEKVALVSPRIYPRIPVAEGFCLMISRKLIETVGLFGPGEEVDLSCRAREKGFEIVCADDVFVYHAGPNSEGNPRLERQGISEFVRSKPFEVLLDRIETWP